ncbi:MAG: DNA-processing protein DprA [Bryobacteraceae bacterium]|nr:DNA-processing protein DprA [Bryobacteraceae bacterium]MDW8378230.1 DNA-processing protein DprA [Bryobacterales bacterium]
MPASPAPASLPSPIGREEQLYWLALQLIPGLGPRRVLSLLERFQTPAAIFRATASELEAAGAPLGAAHAITSGSTFDEAVSQQEKALALGVNVVTFADAHYPRALRSIFEPPPLLFLRGRVDLLQSLMIAIVGTRRPTAYGISASEQLARQLAEHGVTVTSGMARGIDTAAHRGALQIGGNTAAVLGCGVDVVYPAENRKLADEIATKGLLISEFPMSTPAYPQNFPIRNRLVSGLSAGVVVVEGARHSGSMITARLAIEQGRELYAVPGNITSKLSWGPNLLIKQGATLVQSVEDILTTLSEEDQRRLKKPLAPSGFEQGQLELQAPAAQAMVSPAARQLLKLIPLDEPLHLDALLDSGLPLSSSETIAALFELEMAGLVRQLPGKRYLKVW